MNEKSKNDGMKRGSTDAIQAQWQVARPDVDASIMATVGDIWRTADVLRQGVTRFLKTRQLDMPSFDVLMTLRRQPACQALSPSELAAEMMMSGSAMTSRLDKLEQKGLIERQSVPGDRRALKIALTDAGFTLVDQIVAPHVENEERMLRHLTSEERQTLRSLLSKVSSD